MIERFRRQTARQDLELVVVTGCARDVAALLAFREEFAALQVVEFASTDIAAARAQGIRSATAPIVFIAETHSYAHPTMAEALIGAFDDRWAAVVPALGNANPKGVLSWAAFICDYGIWVTRPAGEIPQAPPHNAAYRRSMLLELQDGLGPALALGGDLPGWMQARNYRTYFEPAARIDHVNVTRFRDWADERFVSGMAIASNRLPHWSLARRLAYVAGSILIPAVLVWRVLPGLRQAARLTRLPPQPCPPSSPEPSSGQPGSFAHTWALRRRMLIARCWSTRCINSRTWRAARHEGQAGEHPVRSDRVRRDCVLGASARTRAREGRDSRRRGRPRRGRSRQGGQSGSRAGVRRRRGITRAGRHRRGRDRHAHTDPCRPGRGRIARSQAFLRRKARRMRCGRCPPRDRGGAAGRRHSVHGFQPAVSPAIPAGTVAHCFGKNRSRTRGADEFLRTYRTGWTAPVETARSTGGGVLLDLGSHHVDLARWLLDDEVIESEGRLASEQSEDDTAWLRLRMGRGAEVRSFFSFRAARADFLELLGERGTLRIDRHLTSLSLRADRRFGYGVRKAWDPPDREVVGLATVRMLRPSYDPSFRHAHTAFVSAIRGGAPQIPTLADGLRSLEAILAAEDSARKLQYNTVASDC